MNKVLKMVLVPLLAAALGLALPTDATLAHYCDDHYDGQQARENCWWRYWNHRPSPQDRQFQAPPASAGAEAPGHYCDVHYTGQQAREDCWWRYWNDRPTPQDRQFRQPPASPSSEPPQVVARPTGARVLNISDRGPGGDGDGADNDDAPSVDEAIDTAETVVIDYPTDPADPEQADTHWQTEQRVADAGKPYVVCFPAETVVVHVDAEGVETTRSYPEECILVTPKK